MIERMLLELPSVLDVNIHCSGKDGHCTNRPVVFHPESNLWYCAGDAWVLMRDNPIDMECLSLAIKARHGHLSRFNLT